MHGDHFCTDLPALSTQAQLTQCGAQRAEDLVLRDFNFCVIDEVDSILVDEARTPLIISGNAERPSGRYYQVC